MHLSQRKKIAHPFLRECTYFKHVKKTVIKLSISAYIWVSDIDIDK